MVSVKEKWQCSLDAAGSDVLQEFSQKQCDYERTKFVGEVFQKPKIFDEPVGKDTKLANKFRELGNIQYKTKALQSALILYTKSAAYAPMNSKELALALSNRSASSLALKQPECALIDVKRALSVPDLDLPLTEKLESRRMECEKEIERCSKTAPRLCLPNLSTQNTYFNCATKKVQLAENDHLGRYLIAKEVVKAGEVLMIEEPFASILIPECLYTNCYNCYKYCLSLRPCDKCSSCLYCSEECLTANSDIHKIECEVVERLTKLKLGKLDYLALRIVLEASNCGRTLNELQSRLANCDKTEKYHSKDFIHVYNLIGNTKKRSTADLLQRTLMAHTIMLALDSFSNFFDHFPDLKNFTASVLLRFLKNLPCNAHEISEFRNGELIEVAGAAYATFSLLNHSCDPNVVRQNIGNRVLLRAIRDIKEGAELVDNYGYHYATHDLQVRRSGLKQYYFTCECVACSEKWPLYHDLPVEPVLKTNDPSTHSTFHKLRSKFEEKLQLVLENNVSVETIDFLCKYLSFLDENVQLPWQDYNKCQEAIKYGLNYFPDFNRTE